MRSAALAQKQHAEIFLGEVDQLKIESEGHCLVEGLLGIQACHFLGQFRRCRGVTGPTRFGQAAQSFNPRQRLGPGQF